MHRGTTWIDRHQPDNVDAQRVQTVQLLLGSLEGSLWCKGAYVHLIDDTVLVADGLRVVYALTDGRAPATGCDEQDD